MALIEIIFNNTTFDERHIFNDPVYYRTINPETDFIFGVTSCAQYKFELNAIYENLPDIQGKEFTLTVKGEQIGIFTAEKPVKVSDNIVSVTAYDRMRNFDIFIDEWLDGVTYPITIYELLTALCEFCDVELENDSITNGWFTLYEKPAVINITGMELLQHIAEIAGSFAMITPSGNLLLRWYEEKHDENGEIIEITSINDSDEAEYTTDRITSLQISSTTITTPIPARSERNMYIIKGNPLIITDSVADLKVMGGNIYEKIKNFTYVPFKLNAPRDDLNINAGDIINIRTRKNKLIRAYIMTYEARGITLFRFSANATGNKQRENETDQLSTSIINNADVNEHITDRIIEVVENEVIVAENAMIMNAWIRYLLVEFLETNFEALDIRQPAPPNNERNFIRIFNQSIDLINAVLDPVEVENYITPYNDQIYWTAINDHPQAYKYFTITDPATVHPNARELNPEEQEEFREQFRVKIRKTLEENKRHTIEFDQDDPLKIPQHTWGRGNEAGNGKGYTYKDLDGLYFTYTIRHAAPGGLPAGAEIGIRIIDEGVQYLDITDGQWKNIGTSGEGDIIGKSIIECVHVSSAGRDVTLRIPDARVTELIPRSTYQFNVIYNIPANPILRILRYDGELLATHEWKWQNGQNILTTDFIIGARVQVLDSGASFFSSGAALKRESESAWFQKAVGEKTILRFAMIGNVVGIRGSI